MLLVLGSTVARVDAALGDPNFDPAHPEGILKSDPALLYYLSERVVTSGGLAPLDWRADARIQYPHSTDIPAEFTVGQEFLLVWTLKVVHALGFDPSLLITALWLFAFTMSCSLVAVWGIARELTRVRTASHLPALFAALLWALLPANYRTIGFVLVREDLSMPLLAFALWLVVRAMRTGSGKAFFWSGAMLALALSTWHAMGFIVALLLVAPVAWLVRSSESVLSAPKAGWVLAAPFAAAIVVPALHAAGAVGSPAALLGAGLFAAGLGARRGARIETRWALFGVAAGCVLILAGALGGEGPGPGAYRHVYDVLWAKMHLLGQRPADPNRISFDARLLWQGPFETLAPGGFGHYLGWGLPFLVGGVVLGWWGFGPHAKAHVEEGQRVTRAEVLLVAGALVFLPASWLVSRVIVLEGLLVPLLAAQLLARCNKPWLRGLQAALVLVLQGAFFFVPWIEHFQSSWYLPPGRQSEIAALVQWVGKNVPRAEPICTDFMNGPALLAHCGNPIVLQPKYETERSRRQAERFLTTFFHGSPAEFLALVRKQFRCRYLLIDRYTLGFLSRWTAGLADGTPLPVGSAAEVFLSQDPEVLNNVAGAKLLYQSPATIRQSDGSPYDFFRLYRL